MLFQIGTLAIDLDELVTESSSNIAVSRSIENEPNTEYVVGQNKNFYQIKVKSNEIIHKYSFKIRLPHSKFIILDKMFYDQRQVDFYNFDPATDSVLSTLLEFKSSLSPKPTSRCIIKSLEILDSLFKDGLVYYELEINIAEI